MPLISEFLAASGLFFASGGEARRHAEGQGAAAPAAAARAADSTAQQRLHLGKPGRPGDPHAAVFGRKCRSQEQLCLLLLFFVVRLPLLPSVLDFCTVLSFLGHILAFNVWILR